MKQLIKTLTLLCSVALIMSACDKEGGFDDNIKTDSDKPIEFTGTVGSETQTRLTGNNWDEGDAIGIYAYLSSDTDKSEVFDGNENIKHVTSDGNGNFSAVSESIYYPAEGSLDFIAYYPYQKEIVDNEYIIDLSNQQDPGKIDLLFSDNAEEVGRDSESVGLEFKHMLSKLTINVYLGDNINSLSDMEVRANGVIAKGSFNLISKKFNLGENNSNSIKANTVVDGDDNKATATLMLIPGQKLSDMELAFMVDGHTLLWEASIKEVEKLKSGTEYSVKLKLSATGVAALGGATIGEWNKVVDEDETEIVVKPEKPGKDDDDEGEGDGDEGEGGDNTGVEDDDTITEADKDKLLFPEANFEINTLDINLGNITHYVSLKEKEGINGSKALLIEGIRMQDNKSCFIAKITSDKKMNDHSKISFYLKGKFNKSMSVGIGYTNSASSKSPNHFNLGEVTKSKTIDRSNSYDYSGSIDTNDSWVKITLDISEIGNEGGKDDCFAIWVPSFSKDDGYILIDEITIE